MSAPPFRLDPDSDDAIREHAYLIERGTRYVATLGMVKADDETMGAARARLGGLALTSRVLPFVINRGDGYAMCGYATNKWCVDLLVWCFSVPIPSQYQAMVLGALLGYSSSSIEEYVNRRAVMTARPPG